MLNFWHSINLCDSLLAALSRPGNREAYVCSLYMITKKISIADKLCSLMFCQNKLKKNKCFHPQPIVFVNIWSIQTTKHSIGVMLLKLCRILDHQRVMGGCWTGNFSYYCLSQKHQHQLAFLSWWRARYLPTSKTAPVATQDLLAQKCASAWQTMKHVVTAMVWPASVTQKKTMKRVALRGTVK